MAVSAGADGAVKIGFLTDSGASGAFELSHRQVLTVFSGLLLGVFLSAVDATIVTTALPTIAGELGGLDQLTWVLTAYLLTSTAFTPLGGKLSDLYGRRVVFEGAIALFLLTSVIAGLAQSMPQLVVARALQGVGGGALQSIAFIIVGDILSPRERGRYMGYFTATFAVASLAGPLLGGFFVDNLSWRWIFFVNLPLGIVALFLVHRVLQLPFPRRDHAVDYVGAVLLVISVTAVLLVAELGGKDLAWSSPGLLALAALGVGLAVVFLLWERRVAEPIIPLRIFSNRVVANIMVVSVLAGASMMGANAFLPLFLQVVTNASATNSGLLLAPMMAGLTTMSIVGGRLVSKTGRYKPLMIGGSLVMTAAMSMLLLLDASTQRWQVVPIMVIMGAGAGSMWPVMSVALQNALEVRDLGAGTASYTFMRMLGQTLGVALYGAMLTAGLRASLRGSLSTGNNAGAADLDVESLLGSPNQIRALEPALRNAVVEAVAAGVHRVFLAAVPLAVLMVIGVLVTKEIPLRTRSGMAERQQEMGGEGTGPAARAAGASTASQPTTG